MTIRDFLDQMNDVLDQLISAYEEAPEVDAQGSTEDDAEAIADDTEVDAEDTEESNLFSVYKELEDQILTAVEALGEDVEVALSVSSVEVTEDGTVNVTMNINGTDQVFTV